MAPLIPPLVPTVHHYVETLKQAHAKHLAIHRAHHHLAAQIATERRTMIAAGQTPTLISTPPSGAPGSEGSPGPTP